MKVYRNRRPDEVIQDLLTESGILATTKLSIGIGITTRNRKLTFLKSYIKIIEFLPPGAKVVVVDDASDFPYVIANHRFEQNVGIARAKNKCLELLDDCEHIFLFDDDTYPRSRDWWKPYVESNEPHLMYQFRLPGKPKSDMQELYRDSEVVAYSHTRGCMIYVHRSVLDVVGGMDTAYGEAMYEHTDWTNRIHNAGLTSHRAMDVVDSDRLIYCRDQDVGIQSSIPPDVRRKNLLAHRGLYRKSKTSKEYKEYRT